MSSLPPKPPFSHFDTRGNIISPPSYYTGYKTSSEASTFLDSGEKGSRSVIVDALQRLRTEQDKVIATLVERDEANQERLAEIQNQYDLVQHDYVFLRNSYEDLSRSASSTQTALDGARQELEVAHHRLQTTEKMQVQLHEDHAILRGEVQRLDQLALLQHEHERCGPNMELLTVSIKAAEAQTEAMAGDLQDTVVALSTTTEQLSRATDVIATVNTLLHCDLCLQYIARSKVPPVILPCGHLFCQDCVLHWNEEQQKDQQRPFDWYCPSDIVPIEYTCPGCRAFHRVPPALMHGVSDLIDQLEPFVPASPPLSPRFLAHQVPELEESE